MLLWKQVSKELRFTALNYLNKRSVDLTTKNMPFYAVAKGRTPGIFMTWNDCEVQVKGYSGAKYKKFDTIDAAQQFITTAGGSKISTDKPTTKSKQINLKPNSVVPNLKRSFSTTTKVERDIYGESSFTQNESKKSTRKSIKKANKSDEYFSDDSEDLNSVLSKQMDDIEKRMKGFEKGIDKIIKKGTAKTSGKKSILLEALPIKKRRTSNADFETDSQGFVQVYTDGACSANGRSGARAGIGVFWGDGHVLNTSEPVSGRATNNCGEIQAATHAIKLALQNGIKQLAIHTDSQFLINAVTKWMPGWKRKGWKLKSGEPVKNEVDFKELDSFQNKLTVKWVYVEAHCGIHGNEMADQLAKAGAALYNNS